MCTTSEVIFAQTFTVWTMGNICLKKLPPEDPTPDPVSGMTQREKRLLKELFLQLTEHATLKEEGVKFCQKLFQKFPIMIEYYPCIGSQDVQDKDKSTALRAHGVGVMFGVTAYIECLDDPETVVSLVQKLASSHSKYGVTAEEMEKLLEILFEFIEDECRPVVCTESFVALRKLMAFHNKIYKSHLHTLVPEHSDHSDSLLPER